MTLQHIVLFSFPADPTPRQAEEIRSSVAGWPGVIPGIRALRFGPDLTNARTRGYQFLLYMEFDSEDDLRTYQAHPVHQQFLAWVIDNDITPLAFDYHLTGETMFLPTEDARDPST